MKTLIINGSPRKSGDSIYILNKLIEKLNGEVILINVCDENVEACTDCRYCWNVTDCKIKDDMFKVYDLLDLVDNVVLSAPIYFSELCGQLLSYTSRFQRYFAERVLRDNHKFEMKNKRGALVLSAGGDCHDINRPIETANIIFRHINTKSVGTISTMKTNIVPACEDPDIEYQVDRVADILNKKQT